jgi:hypothetical protein
MKRNIFDRLGYFKWSVHNLFAHPLMEALHLIGLSSWGDKIRNLTIPEPSHSDSHKVNLDEGHSKR